MTTETDTRVRGSEDIWLDGAYDLLTEGGVEAVTVMALARRLGLTRTGFYWYFPDREALLEGMILRWEDKNTGNLVARCNAFADTIAEAMLNLFDCWVDAELFDARLDLAIRNWARTDPALQGRLDRADQTRRDAVAGLFRRFGFSGEEAEVRSLTVLYTQIGYISMQVKEPWEQRTSRMPTYIRVFTDSMPTQAEMARFLDRNHPT